MSISPFKLNFNVNAPHYDPEDWIDEDILSDIDDELDNDPEFQAWLTSADTEESAGEGSSSVWVPLSPADWERANKIAQAHPSSSFGELIRQNTLAAAALTRYLDSHGIAVEREAADHSSAILQLLNPTADVVLPKLGKLEALLVPLEGRSASGDFDPIRVEIDLNPATLAYVILSLEKDGAELQGVLLASDLMQDFPEGGGVSLALMKPLAALWEGYHTWQRQAEFMAQRSEARDWSLEDRAETISFLNHLLLNVPDYERPNQLADFLEEKATGETDRRNLQAVREEGPAPIEADSGDWLGLAMDWLDELEEGEW